MEFSKNYRQALCTHLRTLFVTDDTDAAQETHFFTGTPPDLGTLTTAMTNEWYTLGGTPIAPNEEASTFFPQWRGQCKRFLKTFSWGYYKKDVMIPEDLTNAEPASSIEIEMPVGVLGTPNTGTLAPFLEGATARDEKITWALTLWRSRHTTNTTSLLPHTWYVMHRVGVPSDPTAEIIVADNTVSATNATLFVSAIYSPVL